MENLNQANEAIYHALEKLLEISKDDTMSDQQRKAIYDVIDDIEKACRGKAKIFFNINYKRNACLFMAYGV